jgi:hypothetical protein
MDNRGERSWMEVFRLITPFLLLVLSIIGASINGRLTDIDTKLFRHLTNDELHAPRSLMVTKAEYEATQRGIESDVREIKDMLKEASRCEKNPIVRSY